MILKRIAQHQGIVGIENNETSLIICLNISKIAWGMNLYKKMSTLLILEIGRLLSLFPYESLEMSGDEMSRIGSIVRSHYMGSCYCLLWKLNDCVANYSRGFPVIFFLYHVTLFFCCCLCRLPTMNKVLYYKVMHKYLFLREKRATEALGN